MIAIMQVAFTKIFAGADPIDLPAGQTLFVRGDTVGFAYLVEAGRIALQRTTPAGGVLMLHEASPGQIAGEALLYSPTCHCDAVAVAPSRVLRMPKSQVLDALERDAALAREWSAHLAHGIQAARMRAEIRGLRTVAERLDAWRAAGHTVPPHGQLQDLAAELGVTREALYRELAREREPRF